MTTDAAKPGTGAFARFLLVATIFLYVVVQFVWMTATTLQPITLPDNLPQAQASQPLLVGLGPDEKEHFLYILSIANRGAVPKPSPNWRTSPEQYVSYQAQHPPLFYAVAAIIYKAVGNAAGPRNIWYILRSLCILCGVGVVLVADRAAKTAFPDRPLVALGTGPFVAFLPMFGHMTGNLSNEPLAMLLGATVWLQSVRLIRSSKTPTIRQAAILGATLGLACLTRLTALMWLPVVAVALLRGGKRALPAAAVGLAIFAVLLAPWLAYNQASYGHAFLRTFDRPLLGSGAIGDFLGRGIVPAEFPVPISAGYSVLWYASTAWWPFWLVQFYLPGWPDPAHMANLQRLFLALPVVVLLLLALYSSNQRELEKSGQTTDAAGRVLLWAAATSLIFCLAVLVQQELFSDWNVVLSAGRYIVVATPASALLLTFALSTLPALNRPVAAVVLAIVMFAFGLNSALLVRRYYQDHPTQDDVQPIKSAFVPRGSTLAV